MATLQALQRLIERFENRGIIIGGVAVSLLGKPRFTADADAVIFASIVNLDELIRAADEEGFEPRVENARELAQRNRILLLKHRETKITCDISLGALPFESEAISRSRMVQVGSLHLRIPTVEDLVIFKAVAHRPQDLIDIRMLVEVHPDLDRERIKSWVQDFAAVLETPEIWEDVEKILVR